MAVKTFISTDVTEADRLTNEFMKKKKADLPVRTNVIETVKGELFYVYTVFYNDNLPPRIIMDEIPEETVDEPAIQEIKDEPKKKNPDRLGALWKRKDGTISGTFADGKIMMTPEVWDSLKETTTKAGNMMKLGIYKGQSFRIIENQFKKAPMHPDYIILKGD